MIVVLAAELFGRPIPNSGFGVAAIVIVVFFFLASRNGGLENGGALRPGGRVGRGRMHKCARCGRNFQPETVELLSTGQTRTYYDERCPNCGYELDWVDPRKKPGGSSGTW